TIAEVAAELRQESRISLVRIGAYPNLAMKWLVPRLKQLRARVPGTEIEIGTKVQPLPELFTECHLAVRTYEDAPQFSFEPLFTAELFPVAAPGLVTQPDPTARDLLNYPLLALRHASNDWRHWFEACDIELEGI